jgi:general secretion pathway protein G
MKLKSNVGNSNLRISNLPNSSLRQRSDSVNDRAVQACAGKLSPRKACCRCSAKGNRGFTLIEMAVVIAMILVLLSIAMPMYNQAITHAREAKLRQNLSTLNEVIEKYSLDKGKAPQSLDDLVQAGYIKFIPEDITGTADTWKTDGEDDPE